MARMAEQEIERLKREVSIEQLARARGVELKRHGSDLIGLCPFHDDHEPSLVISPEKNLWHCLGACQAGGSVIDWVMKAEGVSFRHAVELLRAELPTLAASPSSGPVKRSTICRLPLPTSPEAEDRELLGQVIHYYHETLKQSPEALAYLEKRGLRSSEMIERFKLGYANRTLGYRLPAKSRAAGEKIRGQLQRLGIFRESGHEHFNGSLVIPIFDEHGQVVEVYGRKILSGLRPGTPLHLYLPGPHRGVWNLEARHASQEIILCEALIDALTFWCAGYRNVTASYGIEGFTAEMLAAFHRLGIRRVLIAYDRDDAGEKAAKLLADRLLAEGIECHRILFPRGMDANEYALKVPPAEKSPGSSPELAPGSIRGQALGQLIRQAVRLGRGGEMEPAAKEEMALAREKPARPMEVTPSPTDLAAKGEKVLSETEEGVRPEPVVSLPEPLPPLVAPSESSISLPPALSEETPVEAKGEEIVIHLGDRRWWVRGLAKNLSFDQLKVNLLAARGEGFFVDTLDLYSARARTAFSKQAAVELGLKEEAVKKDLGRVLLKIEALQEEEIAKALEPKEKPVVLSEEEKAQALEILQDPRLLERILSDFERCGVVGEETNKLVGYLACVSRKLEEPLAVILQSSSAAGKTALMEAFLSFLPPEEQAKYSAMTGQSLFYLGEKDLKHKVLAIVEEEGAQRASYALKLLQSEGELSIASTGKDPTSGRLVTHEYRVEGPVMILLTTTAIEIDEELLNRCIILTVDEERGQTRAIHRLQREGQTLEGLLARKERESILKLHQNAQRLLRPLWVANPFAPRLTFLDDRTRTRRDHLKYLTLIRTIALLHQYQRPTKSVAHQGQAMPYLEVTLEDIATANRLAHEVLGRSLDELPPQTRRLLVRLDQMATEAGLRLKRERCDYRFTGREAREYTGWGNTQLKVHLRRLVELEYLLVHRGGRGQSFVYELLYDGQGQDGRPFLVGLIDVDRLRGGHHYDENRSGFEGDRSGLTEELAGPKRPKNGGISGPGRGEEISQTPHQNGISADSSEEEPKKHRYGDRRNGPVTRSSPS